MQKPVCKNTQQQVGAKTATVQSAAGRLGVAKAQLDRAQRNYDRVMKVLEENPGALSLADRDAAETALTQAVEQVASAEADLEKAEQQLGVSGPDNPQVRSAVVALEQAHLNLAFSTIVTPSQRNSGKLQCGSWILCFSRSAFSHAGYLHRSLDPGGPKRK